MTSNIEQKKIIRSKIEKYRDGKSPRATYIIELSDNSLRLISQMLHLYMINNPQSKSAMDLFMQVSRQTELLHDNPIQHQVYIDEFEAPPECKTLSDGYYKEYIEL